MSKCSLLLIVAILIPTLLCVSGCTGERTIKADEDYLFTHLEDYEGYDGIVDRSLKLAKILGDSWYGDGDLEVDSDAYSWIEDYSVHAHTQDGKGALAIHIPESAGMSQLDFILLTTEDYGRTWTPGAGPYHIVGGVAQIAINDDCIYLVVDSGANCNSYVLVSEDFGVSFRRYSSDRIVPVKHRSRISELDEIYMRIINVESDGGLVLQFYSRYGFCDLGSEESDYYFEYKNTFTSDNERIIMILHTDVSFSDFKTLYADDSFFG